jgi:hypothetical protein
VKTKATPDAAVKSLKTQQQIIAILITRRSAGFTINPQYAPRAPRTKAGNFKAAQ